MDLLHELIGFAAKGFVIFVTIAASTAVVVALVRRRRRSGWSRLEVTPLNERFEALGDALRNTLLGGKELKALHKERKRAAAEPVAPGKRVYVLDFDGDLLATAVSSLREEVSAIVSAARPDDEVVLRLESPGGAVPHYGLAAAQLQRLREKKIKLTVCVDRIAASGGYMMACVADSIVAAPFAIVGSIGVVAQVPNLHRLLRKHEVDFEEVTAGEFKRTVSLLGEISPKGRQKFGEQLEETHALFKDFVKTQRPSLDVGRVATGEYWLARRGLELGLVDSLATSDEYLLSRAGEAKLLQVRYRADDNWRQRVVRATTQIAERSVLSLLTRMQALQLR